MYKWLGTQVEGEVSLMPGESINIFGQWFNESASVVGCFLDTTGEVMADSDGLFEFHVNVMPAKCL